MGVGGWVVIVLVKKQKNLETKINKILVSPHSIFYFYFKFVVGIAFDPVFFFLHLVMTLPMHPFIITFFHRRVLVPNLIYFSTLHAHAHMCLINF